MEGRERSAVRPLDRVALARVVGRLHRAAAAPWLHGEVARRMAERLPVIRLQPRRIVDWGAYLGASGDALGRAYPRARRFAVEADAACRDAAARLPASPWWSPGRWRGSAAPAATAAELGAGQAELVWSNMGLHYAIDPQAVIGAWHRSLAVDGFLMFSTLGPGSLTGLQAVYSASGWGVPFAPFVDMHDLGDMLIEAGFADPVMDQEIVTLSWPGADALLAELRQLGGNVAPDRCDGLRTPRWRQRLSRELGARAGADGRVALEFEIVYGHAFRPPPRPRLAPRTEVPLDDLRAMARAGRRPA